MTGVEMKNEPLRWLVKSRVERFTPDDVARVADLTGAGRVEGDLLLAHGCKPVVSEVDGNGVTTAGLARITSLITGAGGQALTNTSCRIGVGNSATAFNTGQADLVAAAGSANRWFNVMDATYPTTANGVMTFRSSFQSADGNFPWSEWCVDVGAPTVVSGSTVNALMLNRKVAAQGTKGSGSVWTLTVTITLA